MVDFNINIRLDPARAVAGVRQVERSLASLERTGRNVERRLQRALQVNPARAVQGTAQVATGLRGVSVQAGTTRLDINRAFNVDPSRAQTATRLVRRGFGDIAASARNAARNVQRSLNFDATRATAATRTVADGLERADRSARGLQTRLRSAFNVDANRVVSASRQASTAMQATSRSATRLQANVSRAFSARPGALLRAFGQVRTAIRRNLSASRLLEDRLTATFGAAALAAGIAAAIRGLSTFEQSMATVRAITGATSDQFVELRERAQELGITTRFSATEAAEGMQFLARAGFTVDETLQSITGTLLLAQSGALGLGQAADIASNVLTAFRLETTETGRVVDVLALAANSANTTVGQLGEALKFVAPVAAGLNISLEETTAAIGALSNAGLQASTAGTGLRRVLAELESPSNTTLEIFEQLGVQASEVRVSQVGLTQALVRLAAAGTDTGRALQIFGQRGGPAFEVLSSSIPDVVTLTMQLRGAGGAARRVADIMDDNLAGSIRNTVSALSGLLIALGDAGLTRLLTLVFNAITFVVRAVVDLIETFSGLTNVITTVVQVAFVRFILGIAVGAATALGGAIQLLATRVAAATGASLVYGTTTAASVGLARNAWLLLNAAIRANPIFFVISAVVALGIALQPVIERLSGVGRLVSAVSGFFSELASVLFGVSETAEQTGESVRSLTEFVLGLVRGLGQLVTIVANQVLNVLEAFGFSVDNLRSRLRDLVQAVQQLGIVAPMATRSTSMLVDAVGSPNGLADAAGDASEGLDTLAGAGDLWIDRTAVARGASNMFAGGLGMVEVAAVEASGALDMSASSALRAAQGYREAAQAARALASISFANLTDSPFFGDQSLGGRRLGFSGRVVPTGISREQLDAFDRAELFRAQQSGAPVDEQLIERARNAVFREADRFGGVNRFSFLDDILGLGQPEDQIQLDPMSLAPFEAAIDGLGSHVSANTRALAQTTDALGETCDLLDLARRNVSAEVEQSRQDFAPGIFQGQRSTQLPPAPVRRRDQGRPPGPETMVISPTFVIEAPNVEVGRSNARQVERAMNNVIRRARTNAGR